MKRITAFILCLLLLVTPFSASAKKDEKQQKEVLCATEDVNIRTKPSTEGEIMAVLKKGEKITVLGEENGWYKVLYDGGEYYIAGEYLTPLAEKEEPTTVVKSTEEANTEESEPPQKQEPTQEPTTEDNSTPRFMVTSYELSEKSLTPGKPAELSITFSNYSHTKALYNLKFELDDPSGEIITTGMPTEYVSHVGAYCDYTWVIELTAINTASIGQHDLQVSVDFEDKSFNSYSSSDTVRVDVKQSVKLDYSGAVLPKKVIQGDTQTVTLELMNTGKSRIYNCTLSFDIEGMQSGGSVFVGNIEPAQSAQGSANLRVDSDALGEVTGKITITYEDDYGKQYKKAADVSTLIEEKVEQVATTEEDEKEKKNPLWWLFILIGLAVGGSAGFGIPWLINDKKQRKEDDLRL